MRVSLKPHPDCRSRAVEAIEVDVEREAETLSRRFVLTGRIADLILPASAPPERGERLWEHSCFEAFVRAPPDPGYWELNFAPSRQWAAYRFEAYRAGMNLAVVSPQVEVASSPDRLDLCATAHIPSAGAWLIGLGAVIEESDGTVSYWALVHPRGRPDFHHRDCFGIELTAAQPE